MLKIYKLPLLVVSILGYFIILFTFSGSVRPAYGQDNTHGIPSISKGPYEVIMFSDVFISDGRWINHRRGANPHTGGGAFEIVPKKKRS